MPEVSKRAGDGFTLTATVKNVGNVPINLSVAVVLSGPRTYPLHEQVIGSLPVNGTYPLYYYDKVPSDAPEEDITFLFPQ